MNPVVGVARDRHLFSFQHQLGIAGRPFQAIFQQIKKFIAPVQSKSCSLIAHGLALPLHSDAFDQRRSRPMGDVSTLERFAFGTAQKAPELPLGRSGYSFAITPEQRSAPLEAGPLKGPAK